MDDSRLARKILNFDFSDDEKLVRDQAARFLNEQCDRRVARQVLEGKQPYAVQAWKGLGEMGLLATTIPEAYGGADAGYPALCLIAEQLGAHVAATPFSSSVYLATEAILMSGCDEQKQAWLPKLATGEMIGTLAVVEGRGVLTAESIGAQVANGALTGKKLIVPDGTIADTAIVLARGNEGLELCVVDLSHDSVARDVVETVDPTRNSATISFNATPVEPLGDGDG